MNILVHSALFVLFVAQGVTSYSNNAVRRLTSSICISICPHQLLIQVNGLGRVGTGFVEKGGLRLSTELCAYEVGGDNFAKYKSCLPKDFNVVAAGGWSNVKKLAVDPKAELVSSIVSSIKNEEVLDSSKVEALVGLLQSQGKGFNSVLVDGDWIPVYTKSGKKSNRAQRVIGKTEKVVANKSNAYSNFLVNKMVFENINYTPRKNGMLKATVKYNPIAANFDKTPGGSIVLRRVSCDIIDAFFKYRRIPKISFPFFKKKGGYLDFLFLDKDMRITRGNQGGLFVHLRPEYLETLSI